MSTFDANMASEKKWVPYSEREEWRDVKPVEQDDGPNPVVAIAYAPEYVDMMNYFRAVLMADERSERALRLTADAIKHNPANYTAWHFRRLCLEATKADLRQEMAFTAKMAMGTPKNYQIWFHRRWLVDRSRDSSMEKSFTAAAIAQDSKNYHAWAHRQWFVAAFDQWEGELEYAETLLEQDVRNNSAWNHRFFVVTRGGSAEVTLDVARREVDFALSKLAEATLNESPCTYARGFVERLGHRQFADLADTLRTLRRLSEPESPSLVALLADVLAARGREGDEGAKEEALHLYGVLAESLDTIRRKYWEFTAEELRTGSAAGVLSSTLPEP